MKAFIGKFKEKFIGDSAFYRYIIALVVPMILQNVVTNFVSLLDNIMVGRVGTAQMTGVSIVNNLIFVFNISVFGAVSGPGIFGAQFFGRGDHEGQKYTFRFRLFAVMLITVIAALVLHFFDTELISLYISETASPEAAALTMKYAKDYLSVMMFTLLPFAIGQAYSSVVRECGETRIPMIGSFSAVAINLVLDYGLIFGKFGLPCLGVKGAAVATVIAKTIEALVVVIWAHVKKERNKYIIGLYKSFYMPAKLVGTMILKGTPLLLNEFMWAAGCATLTQCYSYKGLDVVAGTNIASTMTNLFGVVYLQLGAVIAIVVGQKLGAGKLDEAKDYDNKMFFFAVVVGAGVGIVMLPIAKVFPNLYNTTDEIRGLATYFITIQAIAMPLWSFANASYFTIRSGGKTGITFIFDSGYTWALMVPVAYTLSRFTNLSIYWVYALTTYCDVAKCVLGYFFVKSNMWLNTIVAE